mmetsp:Transcript_60226/g.186408  ORF Transcript_60226/g.186408 Transcript_60226/m.186408 type:complete len:274 (+) Transcript_60226:306-1127(+)
MLKPFKSSFKVVKSWIDTRRDQLASISPADLNSKPLSMPEGDPHLLPAVGAAAYDTRTTPMPAYDLSMPTWSSALPPWGMKATPMVTSEPTSMAMSPGLPPDVLHELEAAARLHMAAHAVGVRQIKGLSTAGVQAVRGGVGAEHGLWQLHGVRLRGEPCMALLRVPGPVQERAVLHQSATQDLRAHFVAECGGMATRVCKVVVLQPLEPFAVERQEGVEHADLRDVVVLEHRQMCVSCVMMVGRCGIGFPMPPASGEPYECWALWRRQQLPNH